MLVLVPVTSAMSVAAYSVVGEKQARTLEPLLATPITTFELLAGKVLGALLPAVALSVHLFAIYLIVAGVFWPGTACSGSCSDRDRSLVLLVGPLAAHGGAAVGRLRFFAGQRCQDRATDRRVGGVCRSRGCSSGSSRRIELTVPVIAGSRWDSSSSTRA